MQRDVQLELRNDEFGQRFIDLFTELAEQSENDLTDFVDLIGSALAGYRVVVLIDAQSIPM